MVAMIIKLGLKGDSCSELDFLFLLSFQYFLLDSLYLVCILKKVGQAPY